MPTTTAPCKTNEDWNEYVTRVLVATKDLPDNVAKPKYNEQYKSLNWYLNGKPHRTDGPAIEWADGTKYWFLNGKRVTEEDHAKRTGGKASVD